MSLVSPQTLLAWHRKLIAKKHDPSEAGEGLAALECPRTPAVRPQNYRQHLGGLLRYYHRDAA